MTPQELIAHGCNVPVRINGRGDLAMDGDVKHIIGEVVLLQRLTKKGLAEVQFAEKLYYVPPKNVELVQ